MEILAEDYIAHFEGRPVPFRPARLVIYGVLEGTDPELTQTQIVNAFSSRFKDSHGIYIDAARSDGHIEDVFYGRDAAFHPNSQRSIDYLGKLTDDDAEMVRHGLKEQPQAAILPHLVVILPRIKRTSE